MGKADIHTHTIYSFDGTATVRAVLKQASDVGLDVIAITDHDEIRGSLEARELASQYGLEVIPGLEVSSNEGHVLGLFIEKPVPAGLSLIETLIRIGDLGGIAVAPHPFNFLPNSLSVKAIIDAIADLQATHVLKGLEVYNMGYSIFNTRAQHFARAILLAKTASSDSHVDWTVGVGETGFEGKTAADLRYALENSTTIPIPARGHFSLSPLIGWMEHMLMRKFGYASDSESLHDPISTRRVELNKKRRN